MKAYYAKSVQTDGKQPTVKEHLQAVSELAEQFGQEINMRKEAGMAGKLHDFGKYTEAFQGVLEHSVQHADHALPGAVCLAQYGQKGIRRSRDAAVRAGAASNPHRKVLLSAVFGNAGVCSLF